MIIAGNNAIQYLGARRTRTAEGVFSTVHRWRGLKADIAAFMATIPAGYVLDEQPEEGGVSSVLEARAADAQDGGEADDAGNIVTTWGFSANVLEQDNLNIDDLDEDDAANVRYKESIVDEASPPSSFVGTFPSQSAEDVFMLRQKGTVSKVTSQWVLRKTTSVSRDYPGVFSANLNEVFTKAQLLVYESSMSAAILAELKDGEYLKVNLNKEEQPDGRVNVTVEYWHADAWAFYYDRYTP